MKQTAAAAVGDQDQPTSLTSIPVLLQPRDPVVLRDGRPFDQEPGARAFSLSFPLPRTVAGAIRTHVIGSAKRHPDASTPWIEKAEAERARLLDVHGPLLVARTAKEPNCWIPYVPAPADVVAYRREMANGETSPTLDFMVLRPVGESELPDGAGCDLPTRAAMPEGMKPAAMHFVNLRPMAIAEDFKAERNVPAFWSLEAAVKWLKHKESDDVKSSLPIAGGEQATAGNGAARDTEMLEGIPALPKETRTHVDICNDTGVATDGMLFSTDGVAFRDEPRGGSDPAPALAMLCNLQTGNPIDAGYSTITFGGERRTANLELRPGSNLWPTPDCSGIDWEQATQLRLQLVTPALFVHGWLPGWMADGVPPGLNGHGLELTLVGCVGERRIPVSGWRMSKIETGKYGTAQEPGPRKLEYAVAAGAVYFFEVTRGRLNADIWEKLWLKPMSDLPRDRAEGFGLTLPGIW